MTDMVTLPRGVVQDAAWALETLDYESTDETRRAAQALRAALAQAGQGEARYIVETSPDQMFWHAASTHASTDSAHAAMLDLAGRLPGWQYVRIRDAAPPPAPAVPEWVACSERMPEQGEEVLVWLAEAPVDGASQIAFDCWDEQHESPVAWSSYTLPIGLGWDSGTDWEGITHWMPLPAAPSAPPPPQQGETR